MYKKLFLILSLLILSLSLYANPYKGKIGLIVLDAGHGGNDPGAVIGNIYEKDIVLNITKELNNLLVNAGYNTILTREDDTFLSLQVRCDFAQSQSFELGTYPIFVSIHANSSTSKEASGYEVYTKQASKKATMLSKVSSDEIILTYSAYSNKQLNSFLNTASKNLATAIDSQIKKTLPDLRQRGVKEADFWVLNASYMPAVLIEVGFMTNDEELKNLTNTSWQKRMAEAIFKAIITI